MTTSAAGSAPDLVLLHAFPLDASMWDGYPAAGRVFLPHQRGFGGTDLGADEPSLDRVAEDVAALLDRAGSRRVILGGLSMGGYVVMACLRHPLVRERCAGIILADTRPTPDAPAAAERRLRMADRVLAEGTELLQEETVPSLLGETTWRERPRVVERVRAIVRICAGSGGRMGPACDGCSSGFDADPAGCRPAGSRRRRCGGCAHAAGGMRGDGEAPPRTRGLCSFPGRAISRRWRSRPCSPRRSPASYVRLEVEARPASQACPASHGR